MVENILDTVNQNNWAFTFPNTSIIDKKLGIEREPTHLNFASSTDLMLYMANDKQDNYSRIQMSIDERIEADPIAQKWRKARTALRKLKHFPKYRVNKFDIYHESAKARQQGKASQEQLNLANGLENEINESSIIIPIGQILFHGRADKNLATDSPYPSFISTSLNPVVARMSAFRRADESHLPIVYILTLGCHLPALWGQTGYSCEYEILLPPLLTSHVNKTYSGRNFDVIEATILRRG